MFNLLYKHAPQYMNPCDEFHIDLRNQRIQNFEGIQALNDQFGCIDFSNNDIKGIPVLPQMSRLTTLLFNNNQIKLVASGFA